MKFFKILSLTLMLLTAVSCGTPKEITYFQDLKPGQTQLAITDPVEIRVRPKDKLSILVNAPDQKLTNMFNLPIISQQVGQESAMGTSRGISGYTVDSEGNISFPVLGKVRVDGMTREQIAEHLTTQLKEQELIKDPVVTVEFGNHYVSVLGEVTRQGRYALDRDQTTIFDVLAMAGDLTIYGERENVKVLRETDGKQRIYEVDLTSGEKLLKSPVFYMQQGDVIYVEPNKTRTLQSTLNGNSVRSTSFWFSLGSLLTSVTSVLMVVLR